MITHFPPVTVVCSILSLVSYNFGLRSLTDQFSPLTIVFVRVLSSVVSSVLVLRTEGRPSGHESRTMMCTSVYSFGPFSTPSLSSPSLSPVEPFSLHTVGPYVRFVLALMRPLDFRKFNKFYFIIR